MPLEGVRELDEALGLLKKSMRGRILKKAVAAGIEPARARAEATIPTGTVPHRTYKGRTVAPGFSRRSIAVSIRGNRTGEKATAALGVAPEAFYAALFIELGTAKNPPRPWLRPALESTQGAQESALADTLRAEITAIAARFNRRNKRRGR